MAGHSQFANIKHRKGAQDVKRAQRFTKLKREIIVAGRLGLPDPAFNPRLRAAIIAARKENMPKDKIDAAIKSSTGNLIDEKYEEVTYEGYGPSGLPIIVHALTNNRNRTASELRFAFSKHGGSLGDSGSVSFLFNHVGFISYKIKDVLFDDFFNYALELGAIDAVELTLFDDKDEENHYYHLFCEVNDFGKVRDALYNKFSDAEIARLCWRPKDPVLVDDSELIAKMLKLIDNLESNDDVQYIDNGFNIVKTIS